MVKLTDKLVLGRARASSLEAVKNLNCWGSGLTDVSVIMKMHNVEVINASANSIDSLRAFSHCSSLRELYLRKNNIGSLNEVFHLKELSELRILWLSGNPCCEKMSSDKYRLTVIKALPMLTKLDNVAITIEELEQAKREGDSIKKPEIIPTDLVKDKQNSSSEENGSDIPPEKSDVKSRSSTFERKTKKETSISSTRSHETKGSLSIEETKPLPKPSGLPTSSKTRTSRQQRALGQSTASRNVLTATLALVEDLDEEALMMLQDAIQDRLHMIRRETGTAISEETSARSSSFSNGSSSPEKVIEPEAV